MKNKNSINLPNFRIWAHLRPLFEINVYYGPSKTHLDDHLKKTNCIKLDNFFFKVLKFKKNWAPFISKMIIVT
jgi:hypothetical protein